MAGMFLGSHNGVMRLCSILKPSGRGTEVCFGLRPHCCICMYMSNSVMVLLSPLCICYVVYVLLSNRIGRAASFALSQLLAMVGSYLYQCRFYPEDIGTGLIQSQAGSQFRPIAPTVTATDLCSFLCLLTFYDIAPVHVVSSYHSDQGTGTWLPSPFCCYF